MEQKQKLYDEIIRKGHSRLVAEELLQILSEWDEATKPKLTPSPAKAEQELELRPIKPLGDWLLAQKDLPPVMLPDGGYWYYGSVLQLLKRYLKEHESTTPPVKEVEPSSDVENTWNSFWKDIVCNPDGTVSMEQVKKELHDFHYVMGEVPKVYRHVTGGRLSKIMYPAETVIGFSDEYMQEIVDRELKDKEIDIVEPPLEEADSEELHFDELWDEFSEHIDDDIDSLSRVAGRSVLTERQYKKLVAKIDMVKNYTSADQAYIRSLEQRVSELSTTPPVKEAGQPVDGPWKFEHHLNETNDERGREFDEWTTITDGTITLYIDQHEDEDGEQELVNLLNKLKAKLDWDRSDEFMMHEYKKMYTEASEFVQDLIKYIDPDPSTLHDLTVDDFIEALKARIAQPASSGLRFISCGKEMPPVEDWYDELPLFLFRGKGDDPRSGWVYVAYLNANEIREAAKGFDYCEWLSDSPAPVQVDPVALIEWMRDNIVISYEGDIWITPEHSRISPKQIFEKYTQSLQPKP